MPTLVIETATTACSVALIDGGRVVAQIHEVVGRGHAERLIPMIAELPGQGRADHILVDCGPGSFTGVRVGLAAARGLGLGWGTSVAGYSSMALLAAVAFAEAQAAESLAVVLNAGHGELFVQRFSGGAMRAIDGLSSLTPEAAATVIPDSLLIGPGAAMLAQARGGGDVRDMLPRAADAVLLPAEFAALPPRPIYGRGPDARLPA